MWLGVFPENVRARRAYEVVGFKAEGVARGNAFFGGATDVTLIKSVLHLRGLEHAPTATNW